MRKQYLQEMAEACAAKLPDNHGFVILAFPFGESENNRLLYTSNADRKDVINVMKEFLINAGAAEDWMQHVK